MPAGHTRREYVRRAGVALLAGLAGCTDGSDTDTTATTSTTVDATPLVTGAMPPFPPFVVGDDLDTLDGFDIDMLAAVIEEAPGYTHENWRVFDAEGWPETFFEAVETETVDVMTGGVTITQDREQRWDIAFTDPYYVVNQAVFVRDDGGFQPTTVEDLSGHTVGAQAETTGADEVQTLVADGPITQDRFRTYPSAQETLTAVETGEIDAGVLDEPVVASYTADFAITVAFVIETDEAYGFVVHEDRADLLGALNEGIELVTTSESRYGDLIFKWF